MHRRRAGRRADPADRRRRRTGSRKWTFLKTRRYGAKPMIGRKRVTNGLRGGERRMRNGLAACTLVSFLS